MQAFETGKHICENVMSACRRQVFLRDVFVFELKASTQQV